MTDASALTIHDCNTLAKYMALPVADCKTVGEVVLAVAATVKVQALVLRSQWVVVQGVRS